MINYAPDGYHLVDAEGKLVSPLQSDLYTSLLVIRQKQIDASNSNAAAKADYLTKLANFQTNLDAGRAEGLTPPTKPLEYTVSDTGLESKGEFLPSLPSPIYPGVTSPGNPSGFKPSTLPPDRIDVILQLLVQILQRLGK